MKRIIGLGIAGLAMATPFIALFIINPLMTLAGFGTIGLIFGVAAFGIWLADS